MKLSKVFLFLVGSALTISLTLGFMENFARPSRPVSEISNSGDLYHELDLAHLGLDESVFSTALRGWQKLMDECKLQTPPILTIADLSQPSVQKRLYVIDLEQRKILFRTYVSHGRNSGDLYATRFSNTPSSFQSSLGFYVTGSSYNGKHGLSLKLFGQEPGFNDQAGDRAIVVHGAGYVSEQFIRQTGRLGRSFGCPAVSQELAEPIIHAIRDGSCLFIYSPDSHYLSQSPVLTTQSR